MLNLDQAASFLAKLQIRDRDTGRRVPFRLNHNQAIALERLKQQQKAGKPLRWITVKSRRVGMSSFTEGLMFCYALANPGLDCRIVAHLDDTVGLLFSVPTDLVNGLRSTHPYLDIPKPTQERIIIPHGDLVTNISIGTARTAAGGRGGGFYFLHLSEAAFYQSSETLTSLLNAVPDDPNTLVSIESTAFGKVGMGEAFYKRWLAAIEGDSQYIPIFLSWKDDPACIYDPSILKRKPLDEEEREIKQLYKLKDEQLAWRRMTLIDKCESSIDRFHQEYPLCLTADARVSTNLGILPIGEAAKASETESGIVKAWSQQPKSAVWQLKTKRGRVLKGTHHHPIKLANGEWRWLSELQAGDKIQLRSPRFSDQEYVARWCNVATVETSVRISEDWALLLGYYMGDGCFYKTEIGIACDGQDEDIHIEVKRLLDEVIGLSVKRKDIGKVKGRMGCAYFNVRNDRMGGYTPLRELVLKLDLVDKGASSGYLKRKVRVPECIWRSPKSHVRAFLQALFECDGSVTQGVVRFYSKSIDFARDIQLLLLGFGINVKITEIIKKAGSGKEYVGYELGFNRWDSELFFDEIGFRGSRKTAKRRGICESGRKPTPTLMEDEVESVLYIGEDVTYDFTIDNDEHAFSAEGILTHNTWEEAFVASGNPAFTQQEMRLASASKCPPIFRGEISRDGSYEPNESGGLKIFHKPVTKGKRDEKQRLIEESHVYFIGADAARGEEAGGHDFAALVVLDGTTNEIAATYQAKIGPEALADVINALGKEYNRAMVNVEKTGNLGLWVLKVLRDVHKYSNFYFDKSRDDSRYPKKWSSMGVETTYRTRALWFTAFRESIREGGLKVHDESLVAQMDVAQAEMTMGMGTFRVTKGHDDLLLAALISNIACRQYPPPNIKGARSKSLLNAGEEEQPAIPNIKSDHVYMLQRHLKAVKRAETEIKRNKLWGGGAGLDGI